MPSRNLFSAFITLVCATPALGLAHLGPRATDSSADAPDATGWTPKPTSGPLLVGSLSELKHRKRQNTLAALSETCGWYSGDPSQPFSCAPGLACGFNTVNDYFGCCSTDASGFFISSDCAYIATPPASCYDYSQASLCVGECYSSNYVCDATAPYCVSALLDDGNGVALTHFACFTESSIRVLIVESTTSGASTAPGSQASSTAPSISSVQGIISTSPPSTSITSTPIVIPNPTSSSNSSSTSVTPTPVPHSSHVGAIAGGVVAGLAVIAAAVIATIIILRNKKRDQLKRAAPEVSQM